MVSALPKIGEALNETTTHIWDVELAQFWQGVQLPSLCFEQRVTPPGHTEVRTAETRGKLTEAPWINMHTPVLLQTHREPKPWGAEVWFTGIEKRGVSTVQTLCGLHLSLPIFLTMQAGPQGCPVTPPLLKILEPQPNRSCGSLYIEVHEQKWETYIVTGLARELYPDGEGELLFGFSEAKLKEYDGNEAAFRAALLGNVRSYEVIRRALDGETSPSEASSSTSDSTVDEQVQRAEVLWQRVRSFFNVRRVRVGDVIQVPPFVPHSLQAGVQVVEFQTPTYERLILAFNQKVLTQSHWDSERAIALARFGDFESSANRESTGWQTIVRFPEFTVCRGELAPDGYLPVPPASVVSHSLVFVISGEMAIYAGDDAIYMPLSAGKAALLPWPLTSAGVRLRNVGNGSAVCLLV